MIPFEVFRSNALQGLTIVPVKKRPLLNKDQLESWVKREYDRHLKKECICGAKKSKVNLSKKNSIK